MLAGVVNDQLRARNAPGGEYGCLERVIQIILGRHDQGWSGDLLKKQAVEIGRTVDVNAGKAPRSGSTLRIMAITRFRSCAGAASTIPAARRGSG